MTTSTLVTGCSYRNRLFFVQKDTLTVWYLPVDSIGGAASALILGGLFEKGGSIVFITNWSLDSGEGLDDKLIIGTDQGEVAVYSGSNPSDANDWDLVGVYDIGQPMGKNAYCAAGGDVMILTRVGIVPISAAAINRSREELQMAAITKNIAPAWTRYIDSNDAAPWEMMRWADKTMGVITVPNVTAGEAASTLVINMETNAWCRYTGWDARCLGFYQNQLYFGTNSGTVFTAEVGGMDGTVPYTCTYVGLFDMMGSPSYKTIRQARSSFLATSPFVAKVSGSTNYKPVLPTAARSPAYYTLDVWDVVVWDVSSWDNGSGVSVPITKWTSIGRSGFTFAPQIQATFGVVPSPAVELVAYEVTFEVGDLVVAS